MLTFWDIQQVTKQLKPLNVSIILQRETEINKITIINYFGITTLLLVISLTVVLAFYYLIGSESWTEGNNYCSLLIGRFEGPEPILVLHILLIKLRLKTSIEEERELLVDFTRRKSTKKNYRSTSSRLFLITENQMIT